MAEEYISTVLRRGSAVLFWWHLHAINAFEHNTSFVPLSRNVP